MLAQLGARKGGLASAAALSPEERSERARAAVESRWKGHKTVPIDQASVMARLKEPNTPVVIRIAPGDGGKRRRMAIYALAAKGKVAVLDVGSDAVTVAAI